MDVDSLYALYLRHPVITTDSRQCPEGSLFFALKGANFDGNKFAADALRKGCAYAVVDEPDCVVRGDSRYILVNDCLAAFQLLARHHRRQFHIPLIAITGTNGKTTTKELVSAVLSTRYNVLHTEGNYNNDVGVPKTLFRLAPCHQIAVVEMGASHPGDIRRLAQTAEPDYGLITNVGLAHLQGFGSFEGVVRTKGELYDYLRSRQESRVFIDTANKRLVDMAGGLRLIRYTVDDGSRRHEEPCVAGRLTGCSPFLSFSWWTEGGHDDGVHEVSTRLVGSYNIGNMLAAVCVGVHFGIAPAIIDAALASYVPGNDRSQLTRTAFNSLVVDAYNANPTSMAAAIDNFTALTVSGKMAILGQMAELGDASLKEHEKILARLIRSDIAVVWLVGPLFREAAARLALPSLFRLFSDVQEVKAAIATERPQGRLILIKGSNSVRLFELCPLL